MQDFLHKLPQFIGNHAALAALFAILLIGLIVVQLTLLLGKSKELTPAGLTQLINREGALVIDVSSQAEFEKGHVPGARHLLPSQVDPDGKELSKARETPVALVCRNGQASAQVAQKLKKAGFAKVFWLDGGIAAWSEAQMPLARGRT